MGVASDVRAAPVTQETIAESKANSYTGTSMAALSIVITGGTEPSSWATALPKRAITAKMLKKTN